MESHTFALVDEPIDNDEEPTTPTWKVNVLRKGVDEPVGTLVVSATNLPARKRKGKIVWKLPDSGSQTPKFGEHEKKRLWELFKQQKKERRKKQKDPAEAASSEFQAEQYEEQQLAATAVARAVENVTIEEKQQTGDCGNSPWKNGKSIAAVGPAAKRDKPSRETQSVTEVSDSHGKAAGKSKPKQSERKASNGDKKKQTIVEAEKSVLASPTPTRSRPTVPPGSPTPGSPPPPPGFAPPGLTTTDGLTVTPTLSVDNNDAGDHVVVPPSPRAMTPCRSGLSALHHDHPPPPPPPREQLNHHLSTPTPSSVHSRVDEVTGDLIVSPIMNTAPPPPLGTPRTAPLPPLGGSPSLSNPPHHGAATSSAPPLILPSTTGAGFPLHADQPLGTLGALVAQTFIELIPLGRPGEWLAHYAPTALSSLLMGTAQVSSITYNDKLQQWISLSQSAPWECHGWTVQPIVPAEANSNGSSGSCLVVLTGRTVQKQTERLAFTLTLYLRPSATLMNSAIMPPPGTGGGTTLFYQIENDILCLAPLV